jgi:outer membrane usher protein FimD/PapC
MAIRWSRAIAALVLAVTASCATAQSPQERIESTEQAALAPLKAKYPDLVTAFDLAGNRLDLSIDANAYIQTDDNVVERFKHDAAGAWRSAWMKAHPGQHATLTLRLVDFMSRSWATERIRA